MAKKIRIDSTLCRIILGFTISKNEIKPQTTHAGPSLLQKVNELRIQTVLFIFSCKITSSIINNGSNCTHTRVALKSSKVFIIHNTFLIYVISRQNIP